jgi:hypothetical protein
LFGPMRGIAVLGHVPSRCGAITATGPATWLRHEA